MFIAPDELIRANRLMKHDKLWWYVTTTLVNNTFLWFVIEYFSGLPTLLILTLENYILENYVVVTCDRFFLFVAPINSIKSNSETSQREMFVCWTLGR